MPAQVYSFTGFRGNHSGLIFNNLTMKIRSCKIHSSTRIFITCLLVLFSCTEPRTEDPAELTNKALQEFQDIRFGLFIHFGPYARASGVWNNDTLPVRTHAEFLRMAFRIPWEEYHNFASEFNPVSFKAREIVGLAKKAGMKYLVFTAKHCDGFAMYDSDYDKFNIKDGTPYAKDILKQLSQECKSAGIKFGIYYSHTRDWDEYHSVTAYMNDWDWPKEDPARNSQTYLDDKVKKQLTELLTNYGDVFCLWFDVPYIITKEQAKEIYDLVKKHQPACLVNSRIGKDFGDYGVLGDNQVPPGVTEGYWESPATMNRSWGFHVADTNWKSSGDLIAQLVDLSSKNVNYLLNIGPKGDGTVPPESIERLNEIGEWMKVNGESVYHTKPSPWFQEMDGFRVTSGDNALYITLLDNKLEKFTLYNLNNKVLRIRTLEGSRELNFKQEKLSDPSISMLEVVIPVELRTKTLPVVKVYLDGPPHVTDQPTQMNTGDILLPARKAKMIRQEGRLEISGIDGTIDIGEWPYFATRGWTSTKDFLEWEFNLIEPGRFEVQLINVSTARDLGSYLRRWNRIYSDQKDLCIMSFTAGSKTVSGAITGREPVKSIRSTHRPEFISNIGVIELERPGIYKSSLKADFINMNDADGVVVYEVRLKKI